MKKILLAAILAIAAIIVGANTVLADNPPGWNGDVKIHEGAGEPSPVTRDEPKVCTFHLHAFNFDSEEHVDWWIIKGEPFDSLPVLTGSATTSTDGAFVSTVYSLSDGHYKLFWAGEQAGGAKHKVFKVECSTPTPSESPSASPSESVAPSPSSSPTPSPSESVSPSVTPSLTPLPSESTGTGTHHRSILPRPTPPATDVDGAAATVHETPAIGLVILLIASAAAIAGWFAYRNRPKRL